MHAQRTDVRKFVDRPKFVVRPEIADSAIRLLDAEAESFNRGGEPGERALGAMFAGIAESVRDGMSIYSSWT